ncbi:MAG: DUF6600 domain-containing protein [Candidatus Saccharicenans sp.]
MSKKSFFLIMGLAIFLALIPSLKAQEEQPQSEQPKEETKYTNDSVGRVSFIEGKAFIQRAADIGYEEAVINDPVTEGDRIGTSEGRLEIQFGGRNYLRLDNDTKLDIMNLPKKDSDLTRFRVWSGHIYLAINNLNKEKSIEIHTPDSSFYVLEKGIYRIDVEEGRGTEILVFKGLVEAAGEQNSYLVKGEQHLEMAEGRFSSKPSGFRPVADDGFDRWNESRDQATQRLYARRYLPEDMSEFEAELNQYGDWVYVPPYGYVWVPRDVGDDWRPYYNGHWVWVPMTGWTWVPYEPWGWVAFHYGRWHWGIGLGWYWIPTYVWGPAWVSWWWDYDYFAWAPLSWYGYPVVVVNNLFYDRYVGSYPLHSRALVMVRRDQLKARDISRAALRPESLKAANLENKIVLKSNKLPFRPEGSSLTVEKLDAKRVLIRQNNQATGLRSSPESRGTLRPEGLRPSGSAEKPAGEKSGEKLKAPQATKSEGQRTGSAPKSTRTAPPSGKITPKKIRKEEESSASAPRYQSSDSLRKIQTYPSSPNISVRNLNPESSNYYRSSARTPRNYIYPGSRSESRSSSYQLSRSGSSYNAPRYSPLRSGSYSLSSSGSRVSRSSGLSSRFSGSSRISSSSRSGGSVHRRK